MDERRWYVVHAKPHGERAARLHLERRGVEVFYPRLALPRYVARPRPAAPLFPGYLFVHIVLARDFHAVLWSPGVRTLVGAAGRPTPLDDDIVRFLQGRTGPDGVLTARSDLAPGQRVEITGGPFEGLTAIIQRPPDARGRIRLLMELLNGRTIRVRVPVDQVKTSWVA